MWEEVILILVTGSESYYDWVLGLKTKPHHKEKKKKNKNDQNSLGIAVNDFKIFVKLWSRKNIVF